MFTADNTDLEVPKKARRAEVTAAFALGTFVVAGGLDLVLPSSVPLATLLFLLPVGLVTAALGASAGLLVGALSAGFALASAAGLPLPLLVGLMVSRAIGACLCVAAVSKVAADRARYRAQAERDPLTGVLNRRGFFARANEELERARRHQRPISLVFLDLDDFKQVNDRHGHLRGDAVLASLGALLAHGRAGDLAARLGGDEFVLLMPETDRVAAEAALARLRSRAARAASPSSSTSPSTRWRSARRRRNRSVG